MRQVTCHKCKNERPATDEACPHCGTARYPHRRTADEHADYLRAVAERDRYRLDVPRDG
jgi:predicted amidophosphoribosyltransferase